MGFLDNLKNAAKEGVAKAVNLVNEAAEERRAGLPTYEELFNQARKEVTDRMSWECEHGKCALLTTRFVSRFFFSCPMNCACPKKKEFAKCIEIIPDKDCFEFEYGYAQTNEFFLNDVNISYLGLASKSSDMGGNKLYQSCKDELAAKGLSEPEINDKLKYFNIYINGREQRKITDAYIDKYFPAFNNCPKVKNTLVNNTLNLNIPDFENNMVAKFAKALNDKAMSDPEFIIDDEVMSNNLHFFLYSIDFVETMVEGYYPINDNAYFMLNDVTVFNRSEADFAYTLQALYVAAKYAFEYDGEGEPEINIFAFVDENGRYKPAGIGGALVGEAGDTIWNAAKYYIDQIEDEEKKEYYRSIYAAEITSLKDLPNTRADKMEAAMNSIYD